ncbi:MAG: SEC-C metal-binding domain-containing protein, partial [Thermomicrobiales bacterium]
MVDFAAFRYGRRDSFIAGDVLCDPTNSSTKPTAFEPTSKRRRGFPSETRVKRGYRVVHGEKELLEQLGRNDPCPCGSGRRFQDLLP